MSADLLTTELPALSRKENLRLNLALFGPQLVAGPVSYRPKALGATDRLGTATRAVKIVDEMRERYGEGPLWIQAGSEPTLLVLAPRHIKQVLENMPGVFASDTALKKAAFGRFAPDAAVVSRGEAWQSRHAFSTAVYEPDRPMHHLTRPFLAVCASAVADLVSWLDTHNGGRLTLIEIQRMHERLVRRVLFGDAAADDTEVTDWLRVLASDANTAALNRPSKHAHLRPLLLARIDEYAERAEPGSLVSAFAGAPVDHLTGAASQISHAMLALSFTVALGIVRCLALIASDGEAGRLLDEELTSADLLDPAAVAGLKYLEGCVLETLRLYPVPVLYRETVQDTEFDGVQVPAGTQVIIVNSFNHRDERRHWFANRFEPGIWSTAAADDWTLNPFSRGPEDCTGGHLATLVLKAVVGGFWQSRVIRLDRPALDPQQLPHSLNPFKIVLTVSKKD